VKGCLAGDTQAWADLYLKYRTPLYALCISWTRDHASAEDAVHDAFVRAFEQMNRFDLGKAFFPWLAAIARNCVHDASRRRRDQFHDHSQHGVQDRPTSDSRLEAVEDRFLLRRALDSLPRAQRDALLLSEVAGLSYAQVAQSIGSTESAVKSLIFRARIMLRRTLRPLAGILTFRVLRARSSHRGKSMVSAAARFPVGGWFLEDFGVSIVFVACAVLPVGLADSRPASPTVRIPVTTFTSHSAVRSRPIVDTKAIPSESGVSGHKVARVESRFSRGSTRPGTVVPSSSTLTVIISSPDGQVVYRHDSGYSCDGQGADLLPRDGPVRAVC